MREEQDRYHSEKVTKLTMLMAQKSEVPVDAKANDNAWEWLKSALSGRALGMSRQYRVTPDCERVPLADEPSPAPDEPSQDRLLQSLRVLDDMLRSFEQPSSKPDQRKPLRG